MEADTFSAQREQLNEEREQLMKQLELMGRTPGATNLEFDEGFADSGQVTAERGEADALASTLEDNLAAVDGALAKMDAGNYGSCESCDDTIVAERLDAVPSARLCITCASNHR